MTEKTNLPAKAATERSLQKPEELIQGGKVMSIFDHLAELRTRIVRAFVAFFIVFAGTLVFQNDILRFLEVPLINVLPPGSDALHFTGPMDVFLVGMRCAGLAAIVLSCPFWIFQFWKFVEPALYPRERRYILPFVVFSIAMFVGGVSFCFFVVMPMSLSFLINFGREVGVPMITVNDYVDLMLLTLFAFGFVFETPLILVLLGALDLVSAKTLAEYRRIVLVVIVIIAAIFTPPDVISMLAMAAPMYLMFEIALLIIRFLQRKKKPSATSQSAAA